MIMKDSTLSHVNLNHEQINHSFATRLFIILCCLMTIEATNDTHRAKATAFLAMTHTSNRTKLFGDVLDAIDSFNRCDELLNKTSRTELGIQMLFQETNLADSSALPHHECQFLTINTPCNGTIDYNWIMNHCKLLTNILGLQFLDPDTGTGNGHGPLTFKGFPKHLEILQFQNTQIKHINQHALSQLRHLKTLALVGCGLTTYDFDKYRLPPNLYRLDLSHNNLTKIDGSLVQSLRCLSLDDNRYLDGDSLHQLLTLSQTDRISVINCFQKGFQINWTHQMFEKVQSRRLFLRNNHFTCAQLNLRSLVQSLVKAKQLQRNLKQTFRMELIVRLNDLDITACVEQLHEDS
eukprot:316205_1